MRRFRVHTADRVIIITNGLLFNNTKSLAGTVHTIVIVQMEIRPQIRRKKGLHGSLYNITWRNLTNTNAKLI